MDPSGLHPPMNHCFGEIPLPNHPRSSGGAHRRAHSETFIRLPEDLLLESDPDFEIPDIDFSSFSDDNISGDGPFAAELARPDPPVEAEATRRPIPGAHLRSLSVDTAFFEGVSFQGEAAGDGGGAARRGHHRRSGSMDGASSPFEGDFAPPLSGFTKKAIPSEKLSELALIDPKRAKRILANRQSAARSKERKIRYTSELEQKVQTLQTEATTLSAQLSLLQRDTTGLTAENRELKLRLQAMEQHAQLREALNGALREEVQRLKKQIGEVPNAKGNPFSPIQQFAPNYPARPQQLPHPRNHIAQHIHPSQAQVSLSGRGQCLSDPMDLI
ncbi:transcription factor VIP1 [Canna indica]|uniref:Transcription factor VIP1 n=1 Tax=Canna indica TaxID=4628 RepID=A0AAQ3K8C3_9LILI|nr:transcription factor VIP1 [Canna indica]